VTYDEAIIDLKNGEAIESLVSRTMYELKNGVLLAEGLPVEERFMTQEEKEGTWRRVHIIETMEEFNSLSEEELEDIFTAANTHFNYNLKTDRLNQ
jgi:hypothetical protein